MVNAVRLRWAHIWQWEGCAVLVPLLCSPPLLSRSAFPPGHRRRRGCHRGRLCPTPRGLAARHQAMPRSSTGSTGRERPCPRGCCYSMEGFWTLGVLLLSCLLLPNPVSSQTSPNPDQHPAEPEEVPSKHQAVRATQEQKDSGAQEVLPPRPHCVRCCEPPEHRFYPQYQPQINMTILKGEKGERGERGMQGKFGKTGVAGSRGHTGPKGQKGSAGAPGERCKSHYAAFSVGRKKPLHSNDYYQTLIFDTEFVNLYDHFNMFTGKFYCYVPGIYYFSLNVHTWNQKETYLHIMRNGAEVVILYAQVSDRSIMQSQSVMLELREQDEVWVRLYKGERENAVFSDEYDTYITFSGHLIKYSGDP
ncbi:complement C1q tumor necrosis factor-related protein 1 [Lagopus muta]|uniref:complement C1q tumor necrosis factor-related protein 1 n=1 Tax=Lagopus muta TaxID=64668 RepID=UPI00209FDE99|nr:complement C1q tumor necrosis factor-related protein 1 [Lagopus muta]